MPDLFAYLRWRGDLPFGQVPFTELDALLLARLSFTPFGMLPPQAAGKQTTIRDAAEQLGRVPDIGRHFWYPEDKALLDAMAESSRFCSLPLAHYVERTDAEAQTQFSAITIQLGQGLRYISFRGTDDSLIGWKENFNMSFLCPIPAQEQAVEYLDTVAAFEGGTLLLGGHSKGGNLAMYAAAFCNPEIQDRIQQVYNFDGPGFDGQVLAQACYQRMRERMTTFVPQSSIVGMLLEHEEQYIVVKSTQKFSPLQHNVYSWEVERDHLVYLDQITDGSRFIDRTLKGWLADLDAERREKFIDALYTILARTNVRTLQEMDEKWLPCAVSILSSLGELDEETRKLILESLSLLAKNAKKSLGQAVDAWEKSMVSGYRRHEELQHSK